MSYIIERKQNGKEILNRVSDLQGAAIWKVIDSPSRPEFIELAGEKIKAETIMAVSREDSWWPKDEVAQRSKARSRCRYCFVVNPQGSVCGCVNMRRKTFMEEQEQVMGQERLSSERLRAGMMRAIEIALTYPGVTMDSPFVKGYMRRHGVDGA